MYYMQSLSRLKVKTNSFFLLVQVAQILFFYLLFFLPEMQKCNTCNKLISSDIH